MLNGILNAENDWKKIGELQLLVKNYGQVIRFHERHGVGRCGRQITEKLKYPKRLIRAGPSEFYRQPQRGALNYIVKMMAAFLGGRINYE